MKASYTVALEGYAMINGELRQVKFNSITAKGDNILYDVEGVGVIENIVTYKDTASFERGVAFTIRHDTWGKVNEDGTMNLWVLKNGEPFCEAMDLPVDLKTGRPIMPEGVYANRVEAIKNGMYIEIDAEGNKIVHEGIYSKVKLENDQKAFIKSELEPVLKMAEEMGIALFFRGECDALLAANKRKFPNGFEYDCCTDPDSYINACDSTHFFTVESKIEFDSYEAIYGDGKFIELL